MMRKVFLPALLLMLICAACFVPAFADYGYTETSQIPMAREFTVEVVFDAQGNPRVLTDYPYHETRAQEMNLVYNLKGQREAVSLNYRFATGETLISGYSIPGGYDYSDLSKAAEAARPGTAPRRTGSCSTPCASMTIFPMRKGPIPRDSTAWVPAASRAPFITNSVR